jgi:glycosyltransferase involved in cell wall biosynthesis
MLPLTIWMNYPSFYQGDLFRTLIASGEVDLQVVFAKGLTPDRLQLGWQDDLKDYPYSFLDKRQPISHAMRLAWSQRHRIHIVNGLWAEPAFAAALLVFAFSGSQYAIYSEAPDPFMYRSAIKRLLRTCFGKVIVSQATGALPISHLAFEFYKRLGMREQDLYPFGYFRSRGRVASRSADPTSRKGIEIIFVGQIIHRKGIDLLVEAMLPLFDEHPDMHLTIVGEGEMIAALQEHISTLKLTERVVFEGVLPPYKIPSRVVQADLLVLPSRWDGWGVVVNEAFSVGVPVIVSERCGAADLVHEGSNGYVFRSEDVEDLRTCLRQFLDRQMDWPGFRARASAMGSKISIDEVTSYLIKSLKHMCGLVNERTAPPWMELDLSPNRIES